MSRARDFADLASAYSQDALSNRNLIINGGQQVWQRATATTTTTNSAYNTVDRFSYNKGSSGVYTSTRSTDVPSGEGFSFSNKLDVTTADTSVGSGDAYILKHRIEAQNLARLAYGTSGAKTITLSFWVRSNKTGAYTINLYKHDNTAYNYVREFSISSADTWEKKELTITPTAGSTSLITNSGGAIDIDNGAGLDINFCLSLGSNYTGSTNDSWSSNGNHYGTSNNINWMDSTSNDFYITGIQLECGSTATEFEHESYGDTLRKCQRYYQSWTNTGLSDGVYAVTPYANRSSLTAPNTSASNQFWLRTSMRANPTCSASGTGTGFNRITGNTEVVTAQYSSTTEDAAMGFGGFTADSEL